MSTTWRISIHKILGMAILGLLVLATSTHAQRPTTAPEPLRPPEEMRPDSLETRRFKMMEMERQVKEPISEEEQKLALTQIAQDYRELQIINNKMMSTSMPAPEPNFLSISRTLEEIRKRAARLKDNLRLADPQEKSDPSKYKPAQNTKEFKTHLLALDDSIMRLVKNPIFKEPDVVKLDEAAKARGELEFIIVTSQLIRKDADRLHKSADKTPD